MSILGPVKPYLTYAAQMRTSVPIMAYNCKLYAVQNGMALLGKHDPAAAADAKAYLMGELADLEAMKSAMGEVDKEHMAMAVDNFVLSVFASVDKEERTCEKITKKNAVDFNRAGHFINVLSVFGPLSEEW